MNNNFAEIVYYNGGQIYSSLTHKQFVQTYILSSNYYSPFRHKLNTGQEYFTTSTFNNYFSGSESGIELDNINLSPAVTLWAALIALDKQDRANYEILFAIDSIEQLQKVAEYYNLPYPINQEIETQIVNNPEQLMQFNLVDRGPTVIAGIKFVNTVPSVFKVYTYPKLSDGWQVYMYGRSYCSQGTLWEAGILKTKRTGGKTIPGLYLYGSGSTSLVKLSESTRFAQKLKVKYINTPQDPNCDTVLNWYGEESDKNGNILRIKKYQLTKQAAAVLTSMTNRGYDLLGYDLCPSVNYWVARAYYDTGTEEEIFFAAESVAMIDSVAEYYKLPIPYSLAQKEILETNPALYRIKYYNLLGLGLGNYIPVVACSITFTNRIPKRLLLYTVIRPWEWGE
jgi:hypothetical protein